MSGDDATQTDASAALARARAAVTDAVSALRAAGARTEVLAEYEPERRRMGVKRAARLRPIGRVWRLGVLVLDEDGGLWSTGKVVRAEKPAIRSVTANSVAVHRAYRAAAVKGGIAEGETVVFDAVPVELSEAALAETSGDAPIVVRDGAVLVRWRPGDPAALSPLEPYLRERVDLLAHPTSSG